MGKDIEKRGHITGFREEIGRAAAEGRDSFFSWFNNAVNADAAFVKGSWDFVCHIACPLAPFVRNPERKTALEIGYGGGRILASACRSFNHVVGVDIHDQNNIVADELKKRGIKNFGLVRTDGRSIPVESLSVDLVYSFIVLQHVEKIDVFDRYFEETHRILKAGGVAILYFGRRTVHSLGRASRGLYLVDRILEAALLRGGYVELPSAVNDVNLLVSCSYAKRLSRRLGLTVLGQVASRKNVPDGINLYGGQHGLILKKE